MSDIVRLSIGECEGLALKALRGVGCHWGLAQEGAFAVGALSERGIPGLRALLTLTQAYDTHGAVSAPARCPLTLGMALVDSADPERELDTLVGTQVLAPALLLPFVARVVMDTGESLALTWRAGSVRVGSCFDIELSTARKLADLEQDVLTAWQPRATGDAATRVKPSVRRAEVWARCHERLTHFAHRTYVPASERSRARAGGTDPDD